MLDAVVLCTILIKFTYVSGSYVEDVNMMPLPDGNTAFHFDFTFLMPESEYPTQHFHLFPKSLYELVHQYGVEEMHLTLTRGYWDHVSWGYGFMPASSSSASLWSWFRGDANSVDSRWKEFTESLSGHFCASLNRLGKAEGCVSPRWTYPRWGLAKNPTKMSPAKVARERKEFLRFAQLVSEPLCTENLTPWLKLLPCRQRLGLASNLNPEKLMKSRYFGLGVQLRSVCGDSECGSIALELKMTLTVVMDHRLLNLDLEKHSWNKLLSTVIKTTCPLSDHTLIHVWLPSMNDDVKASLSPNPTRLLHFPLIQDQKFTIAQYNISELLTQNRYVDVSFTLSETLVQQHFKNLASPVFVSKFATGHGQEESGIECLIRNRDPVRHFRVILLDHLPWYMRIQFRTFRMELNGHAKNPLRTHFLPGRNREHSGHLEILLHLPPQSTVRIQYTFSKLLQRWNEYPPDPHHGFYVPPSTITVKEWKEKGTMKPTSADQLSDNISAYKMALEKALPQDVMSYTDWFNVILDDQENSTKHQERKIHVLEDNGIGVLLFSEPILVTFPTPDFSMPFNVLCMVSTLLVLLFMTIHRHCTTILTFTKPTQVGFLKRIWIRVQSKLMKTPSPENVKDKKD